ncbi:MAG: glycosyltransferase [Saccharospirillaceae bacterium]|nr:glycosyltransferase [Saccharospirillaceae bacterium]
MLNFFLTLESDSLILAEIESEASRLNVSDLIINVGRLSLSECLEYYKRSNIVFLPTLLEVFSATYLEAMAVGVPIVTTDLDFAKDNCGDAALFYSSTSYEDAASKINEVLSDVSVRDMLIERGKLKLSEYPTLKAKYDRLYDIFTEIVVNESASNE